MKYHIRVPAEQFAYLEAEFEGTSEDAVAEYRHLTSLVSGAKGIDPKEFNKVLDAMISNVPIQEDPGIVERMSVEQVGILQAIKRSKARLNK